jgi:methionyl-tRNA formyltransferase
MNSDPRIIFYGTPSIAVASLKRLLDERFNVVAVITAPDKPAGRGLKVAVSPVKEFAISRALPVVQPVSMKDPDFHANLRVYAPDLQVVVAFRMMPKDVWALPPLGTFNLHASLLPQYRGAAPINWAIINGEPETGVTTFFLEEKTDTGQIIFAEKTQIGPEETAGELHDRLMELGARLVVKTVRAIAAGTANAIPQQGLIPEGTLLKPAPKFSREDARIDWSKDHREVFNHIRGMSPYPGAFTEIPMNDGSVLNLKIFRAARETVPGILAGSGFQTDRRTFLKIPARNGFILLQEVQPAGRRIMNISEFLNGFGKLIS